MVNGLLTINYGLLTAKENPYLAPHYFMEKADIIIVGAGAAGLMAAHRLSAGGKKVIVLEARSRTGGRINTLTDSLFFKNTETGAEFIHGNLPVTLDLLKEADIEYHEAGGAFWQFRDGKFVHSHTIIDHWDEVIARLQELGQDIDIRSFIEKEFPGDKYINLRQGVYRFVSGYDTAEPSRASAFAIRDEWQNEDDDAQHRIANGYCAMISYLVQSSKQKGAEVYLNSVVKKIGWGKGEVKVTTADGSVYVSSKMLIALPLGVLQSENQTASITFDPPIGGYADAIKQMGFGAIIKVLFEFDEAFWLDPQYVQGNDFTGMGFLLTSEAIPTWWTQYPTPSNVLTGWLGGPPAQEKKDASEEELLKLSLQSLANIFGIDITTLKSKLVAETIINWTAEPFTLGSYAYDTVGAHQSREVLRQPLEDTIYFAGEYLYEGPAMGTVEAALSSGQEAAKEMIG